MPDRAGIPADIDSRPRRHRSVDHHAHHYDGSTALYSIALGFLVFLLIGALSLRQVSDAGSAKKLLSSAVATSTEIDLLLRDHALLMRESARAGIDPITLPGFPLEVALSREEVLALDDAQLRRVILDRSASILYAEGLGAFDRTGDGSVGTFSSTGLLDAAVGATSESMHDRATIASIVLGLLTGLAALGILVRQEGFRKLRSLGLATLIGAGVGLGISVGLYFIAGNAWSGDPYSDDIAEIMRTVADVPIRNYATAAALGLVLAILGLVLERLAATEPRVEAEAQTNAPPSNRPGFSRTGEEEHEFEI